MTVCNRFLGKTDHTERTTKNPEMVNKAAQAIPRPVHKETNEKTPEYTSDRTRKNGQGNRRKPSVLKMA
jgi:hypothetical protein